MSAPLDGPRPLPARSPKRLLRLARRCGKYRLPGLDPERARRVHASLAARARWLSDRQWEDSLAGPGADRSAVERYPEPAEVDSSLAFAFHYTLGCLRQDRPALFWAGVAGLVYSAIDLASVLWRAISG
jgi:hypothetical protein